MRPSLLLRAAALAASAALALTSCDSPKPETRPNIVLIVVESLRADHLSFYGYDQDTTPFLSRLAPQGVVFRRAVSTSSWAAPATASLMTSLYPIQHGVHTGVLASQTLAEIDPRVTLNRLPDGVRTLAEVLKGAGYSTWGVSDCLDVGPELGFERGFDQFEHLEDMGAARVNAVVEGWASGLGSAKPYFLYVHYADPRRPYITRAPWYKPKVREREDAISAYDSEISYVDQHIEKLFELLAWNKDTWLIVTADHGEEFRDHGDWYHGRTLYSEVLDVPLLVSSTAGSLVPRRIEERVSILDVLPTLRDIAGLPADPMEQGVSLLAVVKGDSTAPAERVLFADLRSAPWFGCREVRAVMRTNAKYVLTLPDREELFNLDADPGELSSLAWNRPEHVADLRSLLERFEAESPKYAGEPLRVSVDPQVVEKLRSAVYSN
jgi:arylsulfatase A-like enzyme